MVKHNSSIDYTPTIERFSGIAETYNASRPSPPSELVNRLTDLAGRENPHLVVDLGCGSGLSTRLWAGAARRVVGIDPVWDMLMLAHEQTKAHNIDYIVALSMDTGLAEQSADIVTCAQSLHWMEPNTTFREVARILRKGGVFAAYDYDWPPDTKSIEIDQAYKALMQSIHSLEEQYGIRDMVKRWSKQRHLERMRASAVFHHVMEFALHHEESGAIERLVQLILSQGSVSTLLKRGLTEKELGLTQFRESTNRFLLGRPHPWILCYRVRVGIK
jgi:ubiquinone/menaquinone biosynthesis C-methylase UbiE